MKSAIGTAALVAATLVAESARADEGLRLAWFAPAGCPSGEDVRAAALRSVQPGTKLAGGLLEADAHVEQQTPSSWRVFLKTKRGATVGEREIEAATCAGVADATAVVLALALVPPSGSEPTLAATPPAPTSTPRPAAPAPPPAEADRSSPGRPLRRRFAAGASMLADIGALPSPAFGGALHVAWTPGRVRLEGHGRLLAGQDRSVAGTDIGAALSVAGVGARGCYAVLELRSIEAAPCVGGGVDVATANGFNADENLRATKAWANVAFGALARAELARWLALRVRVEGLVPLHRPNFVVEGTGSVHHLPTFGAVASFGAEVLFL